MVTELFTIPKKFCGPSETGHGGYVCGRLAKHLHGSATVRLKTGAPLGVELHVETSVGEARLLYGSSVIAEARRADLTLTPPPPPSFEEAERASQSFVAMTRHPFPRCFVCGPQRNAGDGMRIFPGAVEGQSFIAAPWIPGPSFAEGSEYLRPEFLWAALECTGGFAWFPQMVVLGELSGDIKGTLRPGERSVVVGWRIGVEGRKHFAGTAIFSEARKAVALGYATWVEIPKDAFVALSRTGRRTQ